MASAVFANAKRIALFVPSFRGGGAERAMVLFAEGLLSSGYEVDFLVCQDDGPLKNSLAKQVRLINFATSKVSRAVPALIRYLRTERPCALYSTIVNANIAAVCARSLAFVPCPVIIRESNVLNPTGSPTLARKISGFIAPLIYRGADSIISVSRDVAEELSASSPALRRKISVLPNPVISEKILDLANAPIDHPWFNSITPTASKPKVVLGAGRLHPQKDFSSLITAFAEARKVENLRLLILGEGAERKKLELLTRALGLEEDICLPGHVENPFPYLKHADTFVLSSRYEGMPNVLLQAMAFGTPCVATDCHSGAREVLIQEEFGRLVSVGDVSAMSQAILVCLAKPKSLEAASFVAKNFSVTRATREYLHVAGLSI